MRGVRELYNFQFDDSRNSFNKFIDKNPDHPAGYFYIVVLDWFTLRMFESDKNIWNKMKAKLEHVISVAEKRLKLYPDDALSMVYLGAARGLKARIALSRNDFMDTFYDAQAGFSIIQDAMEMEPEMVDPLIGTGVFHYFISISNTMIRSVAYMAGIRTNKEEALQELLTVANEGEYASIEARSFLMFAYAYIEEEYEKALDLSVKLVNEFDKSPYFRGKHADILIMNGKLDEAIEHIDLIPQMTQGLPDKYRNEMATRVKYLRGESLRRRGKPREALILLDGLADDYTLEFKFNLAFIYLSTGMAYDEIGDRNNAVKYYKKAVDLDNYTSAVRMSKLYLKEPYAINSER